jgi:hypothetical protein
MSHDDQRNTLIVKLSGRSNQFVAHFQSLDDATLAGTGRGLAAWLLAIGLLTSPAYAHGGVDVVDNRCVLQIGPNIMFFTASQPQNSRD